MTWRAHLLNPAMSWFLLVIMLLNGLCIKAQLNKMCQSACLPYSCCCRWSSNEDLDRPQIKLTVRQWRWLYQQNCLCCCDGYYHQSTYIRHLNYLWMQEHLTRKYNIRVEVEGRYLHKRSTILPLPMCCSSNTGTSSGATYPYLNETRTQKLFRNIKWCL